MAERRMFAKSIVLSGPFIRLTAKAQLLYFHLGMQADDEGFISAPELAMRAAGASKRDLNQLLQGGFLLGFASGLLVVRHWFLHNNIKKDRFRPTVYQRELEELILCDRVYEWIPDWNPDGTTAEPQIKQKETKENQTRENQTSQMPGSGAWPGTRCDVPRIPSLKDIMIFCLEQQIHTDALGFYNYYQERDWKEDGQLVRDWRRLLKKWEENNAGTP